MQSLYNDFLVIKKKQYQQNFIKNKLKKQRLYNRQKQQQNNNNCIYFNKIDKVYNLENLHRKINWFRYYLELYIMEYLNKINTIKNNKINLK